MNTQLDLTFRNMDTSSSTEFVVREQMEKLERHCPALISCRVVIEAPTAKQTKGGHFKVSLDLRLPGTEIVADRDPELSHSHEDCHAAVRDVFRAALREIDTMHSKETKGKRHARA